MAILAVIYLGLLINANENVKSFYLEQNGSPGYWIPESRVVELIKAEKELELLKLKILNMNEQILLLNKKIVSYENLDKLYKDQLKDYNILKLRNKIFSVTTPAISITFAVILTGGIIYIVVNSIGGG